jgi:hypothetical protein
MNAPDHAALVRCGPRCTCKGARRVERPVPALTGPTPDGFRVVWPDEGTPS